MKFDMFEVFTRAAKITWKYKVLWIFGMLASCGRSGGSNSNSSSRRSVSPGDSPLSPEMMRQMEAFFGRVEAWFQHNTWVLFALFAFVFIAIVLQVFFSLVGTAGLARGVVHAENNVEILRFGELFGEGLDYFWQLLGAALVIWIPYIAIFILSMFAFLVPAMGGQASEAALGGGLVMFLLAFCCCAIPFSIALTLYHFQVKRAILVEGKGVFAALARGWQVFSQNIVAMLIVGILLGIAGFIIGVLLALPVLLIIFPLMQSLIQGNITSWWPFTAAGIFILCYTPAAWFVRGVLTTYTESVWTLTYLRLTQPAQEIPVFVEAHA
ncbi:MAG: hypothetical protein K8S20_05585 [Chloroflexi bacterium]|nr:hypothetical protein [Chloroflexota bacterium]